MQDIIDSFFKKSQILTSHESLATYNDNTLISGGKHDDNLSFYTHINYYTMKQAIEELIKLNKEKYVIVETGCAAHGTKSTLLWDSFVNKFDGSVYSVDLNIIAVKQTRKLVSNKTSVQHQNSLEYLPSLVKQIDTIDFVYFDSFDADFTKNNGSSEHHFQEFLCILPKLHEGSIILIDDTPINSSWLDNALNNPLKTVLENKEIFGKGNKINDYLSRKTNSVKLLHQYQVLWKYIP